MQEVASLFEGSHPLLKALSKPMRQLIVGNLRHFERAAPEDLDYRNASIGNLILAGGVESMSNVPMGSDGGAWASDPATAFKAGFVPQGIGADLIATIEGWSREDVDAFAAESNHRAAKAWANGYFTDSVIPVKDANGLAWPVSRPPSPRSVPTPASTTWRWRSTTGSRRSTTSTTPATPRASSTAPP